MMYTKSAKSKKKGFGFGIPSFPSSSRSNESIDMAFSNPSYAYAEEEEKLEAIDSMYLMTPLGFRVANI